MAAIRAVGFDYLGVMSHHFPRADSAMLELAQDLRAAGYKTGILSNLGAEWAQEFYAEGVQQFVDVTVLSGEAGFAKPDPRAFQTLAQKLGVSAAELVYIDDQAANLVHAESINVRTILYLNTPQLKTDLRALGLSWTGPSSSI